MRLGHRAYWSFNLYPDAGEGGGCFVPTLRARASEGGGAAVDGERSQVEAARRARAKLRRYCAANRLNRSPDPAQARERLPGNKQAQSNEWAWGAPRVHRPSLHSVYYVVGDDREGVGYCQHPPRGLLRTTMTPYG